MLSLLTTALLLSAPGPTAAGDPGGRVAAAIVAAIRERMGADATVLVEDLRVLSPVAAQRMRAIPDPAARLDRPMRFTLESTEPAESRRSARRGRALASVRVILDHAHARRAIGRGHDLRTDDLAPARHAIETGVLRPVPTLAEAHRSRAVRDLAAGACLGRSVLALAPTVRVGDEVVATAVVSGADVSATMVAAQNGGTGSVIRVINAHSRRALKARVVSAGTVEIVHD
ncbi:MAG: flagellar basal body P-ring formation chaperone FlgA [Vicinamibacterales bacterium]|jgi:flagella basal body P-ring formation protein FlgA